MHAPGDTEDKSYEGSRSWCRPRGRRRRRTLRKELNRREARSNIEGSVYGKVKWGGGFNVRYDNGKHNYGKRELYGTKGGAYSEGIDFGKFGCYAVGRIAQVQAQHQGGVERKAEGKNDSSGS